MMFDKYSTRMIFFACDEWPWLFLVTTSKYSVIAIDVLAMWTKSDAFMILQYLSCGILRLFYYCFLHVFDQYRPVISDCTFTVTYVKKCYINFFFTYHLIDKINMFLLYFPNSWTAFTTTIIKIQHQNDNFLTWCLYKIIPGYVFRKLLIRHFGNSIQLGYMRVWRMYHTHCGIVPKLFHNIFLEN